MLIMINDCLKDVEFYEEYDAKKRAWYEERFSYYLRFLYLRLWKDYLLSNKIHSPFCQGFELFYAPTHNIDYPLKDDLITPILNKKNIHKLSLIKKIFQIIHQRRELILTMIF